MTLKNLFDKIVVPTAFTWILHNLECIIYRGIFSTCYNFGQLNKVFSFSFFFFFFFFFFLLLLLSPISIALLDVSTYCCYRCITFMGEKIQNWPHQDKQVYFNRTILALHKYHDCTIEILNSNQSHTLPLRCCLLSYLCS